MPTPKASRFNWDDDKDQKLTDRWLDTEPDVLAQQIGCKRAALYKRAGELKLGPRQKAARAIWNGEKPRDPGVITLAPFRFPSNGDDATADEPARRHAGGSRAALAAAGEAFGRIA
jgi:hypothetical protein